MNAVTNKPHFADIARNLTEGIVSGRFPVGSLLPTELELCDSYSTSRHTIRAALHELQQLGLVSRRKNVGTRVESSEPTNDFRPSLASVDDLVQFGSTHVRKVLEIEETTVSGALATEFGCQNETRWLRISSLRMNGATDRLPVGWTDVYIEPAYAEIGEIVRKSPSVLISALIESRYGRRIAEIRQEIRATTVPDTMARSLQVEPGTTALKIIRWYFDAAGQAFEISVSVHPAERFAVSMQLKRSDLHDKK
ncbi:GntR family transcriptional regulator [Collimonas silvisoli]|uniref:GntR family transcriptional regulator n=1 Tax=Collimonas silvisoli TaxID=2825884 RepID=UPI001B8AA86F|nr:GntR family transcriptional regulator [Collimonas silvisoli]